MSAFCKQCSIVNFGEDYQELAYLGGHAPTLAPGYIYYALCEDCGYTEVNDYGECVAVDCLRKHGAGK